MALDRGMTDAEVFGTQPNPPPATGMTDAEVFGSAPPQPAQLPFELQRLPTNTPYSDNSGNVTNGQQAYINAMLKAGGYDPSKPLNSSQHPGFVGPDQSYQDFDGYVVTPEGKLIVPQGGQYASGILGAGIGAARGAANGLTGGWYDKLESAIRSLPDIAQGKAPGLAYSDNLDQAQHLDRLLSRDQPVTYNAGGILGGVGQVLGAPEVKGATFATRALKGAAFGGLLGAADATGTERGDIGDMAQTAALPALVGAGTGGLLSGAFGARLPKISMGEPEPLPASVEDFGRVGVDVMPATNGSFATRKMGQLVMGLPFGHPIAEAAARQQQQLEQGIARIASQYGDASNPFIAGESVRRGLLGADDAAKEDVNLLYKPFDSVAEQGHGVKPVNTLAALRDIRTAYPGAPDLAFSLNPDVSKIAGGLKFNPTPVGAMMPEASPISEVGLNTLKTIRTHAYDQMGDLIARGQPTQSMNLQQVINGLTGDMRSGLNDIVTNRLGLPSNVAPDIAQQHANMLDLAEAAHGQRMDNLTNVIRPLIGGPDAPKTSEAIFGKLTAMAGSKSNADIEGLNRVISLLPDQSKGDLAAGVISHLGDNNGTFSPSTFATNWAKLSDEGKAALFSHNPEVAADLDASARVAQLMKDNSKFYNHSNTAHGYAGLVALEKGADVPAALVEGNPGKAVGSGISLAASILGTKEAARALAAPGFVSALDAYLATGNLGQAVRSLREVAANNPGVVTSIDKVLGRVASRGPAAIAGDLRAPADWKDDIYPTAPQPLPQLAIQPR